MVIFFNKAKKIMHRDVQNIHEDDTVYDAVKKMNFFKISCLVVTRNSAPVAIITERDMLKRILVKNKDPTKTKIKDIMSMPLVTKKENTPISEIAKLMKDYAIRHIVIVSEEGKLIGIITQTDIVRYMRESLGKKLIIMYMVFGILIASIFFIYFLK